MQKNVVIAIGDDSFEKIRELGYLYIDKTRYIRNILESGSTILQFTRPRRFGKTTFFSTLSSFLDIRKDSSKYFEGLEITNDKEFIKRWMNQYPVIYLTLKDIDGTSFDIAFERLRSYITNLFKSYAFILKEGNLSSWDRKTFLSICDNGSGDG